MTDFALLRHQAFRQDYLAWTTLHHFLPADLVRELAIATISAVAPWSSLEDLFEEALSEGNSAQASWALAPRPLSDPDLNYLQSHIRALAWANDAETAPRTSVSQEKSEGPAAAVSAATRLGHFDFGSRRRKVAQLPLPHASSGRRLADLIATAIGAYGAGDGDWSAVWREADRLPVPLKALALKHVGDLCADADVWDQAAHFYDGAMAALERSPPEWKALTNLLADVVRQSIGSATWVIKGPEHASTMLDEVARPGGGVPKPHLGILNGSHDALVARLAKPHNKNWEDIRATVMFPPLLIQSFDFGQAVEAWLKGGHDRSNRAFWSVLRRQTALGSVTEAKGTKAAYARALISEAIDGDQPKFNPSAFELGIRLLIESGLWDVAARLKFDHFVVERYVELDFIEYLAAVVDRHDGVRDERTLVLFELLAKWTEVLDTDDQVLAERLLMQIVDRVRGRAASFETNRNIGGRGLKLLSALARARPGFRSLIASQIADLVIEKLRGEGFWTGKEEALRLAAEYEDVWTEKDIKRVLDVTMTMTGPRETGRDNPLSGPAMAFLMSPRVIRTAQDDPQLGERFFSEVLHESLGRNDGVTTLFNLAAFDRKITLDARDDAALVAVVQEVLDQARAINSSGATDAIRALLAASSQSGAAGVKGAIDSLARLLMSREAFTPPALPYAYGPILDLVRHAERIAQGAGLSLADIEGFRETTASALADAWRQIAERPELLGGFSIPPARDPNVSIVQNWAFVTQELAKTLQHPQALLSALDGAAEKPVLAGPISLARAVGSNILEDPNPLNTLNSEPNATFYHALGQRLGQIQDCDPDDVRALAGGLLQEVLRRGPREVDLAVFLVAAQAKIIEPALLVELRPYLRRLEADPNLMRVIGPVAFRLQRSLNDFDDDS